MAVDNDDYLWDRTGSDDEVEALEALLKPARWQPEPAPRVEATTGRRFPWISSILTMAAAVLLVIGLALRRPADPGSSLPPPLAEDQTFDLGRYGTVTAAAGSRVSILRQTDEEIRFRLDQGSLEAVITLDARPRLFQVETPATTCIDLGCHYVLSVDAAGRSVVVVTTGRVAFTDGPREVYVPAKATCRAEPGRGSGTPHWLDSSPALVEAVHRFDTLRHDRLAAAKAVIAAATEPEDTLTLWHLLQDDQTEIVKAAFDVLRTKMGVPEGVSEEACLRREAKSISRWKDYLLHDWDR